MNTKTIDHPGHVHSANRVLIVTTVMMVAILEVLDSTIVNVALPYMMPSLSANTEEITWVLTSYVVAAAMMLPLTGFLANRFGQKKLLLISISGFLLSSVCCGLATSIPMMVVCRLLQGGFGAALIPLSQSILRSNFPMHEQGKAMAIWGLGIMAAPVFGPTIGGYITQHLDWRFIFYINVPVCIVALLLTTFFIQDSSKQKSHIDWFGILLMFAGVGSLQMLLDQGNNKDWFNSNFILVLALLSTYCLAYFIIRSNRHATPVIKLAIFKDRNFAVTTAILAVFCGAVFGTITLEPLMMESLFHYTAVIAGTTLMAVGIGSASMMIFVPLLLKKVNEKIILSSALLLGAGALYYLSCLNLTASQSNFVIANLLFGASIGLMMVPLSTYSLLTLPKSDITEGAGLYSYGRMLGSSIGISLCSTIVFRLSQIDWHNLGAKLTLTSPQLKLWLQQQNLTLKSPTAIARLATTLNQQALMQAYVSAFRLIAIALLLLILLVLLIKHVDMQQTT